MLVLSLILTGITSNLRYLSENLLWFRKSAIFSHTFPIVTKGKHFLPQTPHSNVDVGFSFCLVLII